MATLPRPEPQPLTQPQATPQDRLKAPRAAMAQGDLEDALAQFDALLDDHPGFVPAVQGQIACLERAGRPEEAVTRCKEFTSDHGMDPRIAAKHGTLLRQLGRTEEAQSVLEIALEATKGHATVQLELARLFLQQGASAEAARHFRVILETKPEHVPARLGCVAAHERLGNLAAAIALCEAAPRPKADDTRIAARLGLLLRQQGELTRSEGVLTDALARVPEDASLLEELARTLVAADQLDAVDEKFAALQKLKPGYRPALFGRVSCALRRGDRGAARALLQERMPTRVDTADDAEIALRLLEAGLHGVDPDAAARILDMLRQGIDVLSVSQVTRLADQSVARQDGDVLAASITALSQATKLPMEAAVFVVKRALQTASAKLIDALEPALLQKSAPSSHAMIRAECTSFSKGPEAALKILRASSKSPRSATEARAITRYLAQSGNKRVQLRYLRFCFRRWPKTSWVRQSLFQAYHACGDPGAARAFLDQEAKRHPEHRLRKLYAIDLLNQADPFAAYDALKADYTPGDPIVGFPTWFQLAINTGDLETAKTLLPGLQSRTSVALNARYDELVLLEMSRSASGETLEEYAPKVAANFIYPAIKVLHDAGPREIVSTTQADVPRKIFQYWDRAAPPEQITRLMDRWATVEGYEYCRFNRRSARAYLQKTFGPRHARAFTSANHVSEESDFFRLCVLFAEGGIYVDADDRRHSHPDALLSEAPGTMVFREDFGALANNLIGAPPGHPVLERAIRMVMPALLARESDNTWSKTGPGLLTRATAAHVLEAAEKDVDPGITVLPYHRLLRHISPHVRVPYKNTDKYWGNQGSWSTPAERAALQSFVDAAQG